MIPLPPQSVAPLSTATLSNPGQIQNTQQLMDHVSSTGAVPLWAHPQLASQLLNHYGADNSIVAHPGVQIPPHTWEGGNKPPPQYLGPPIQNNPPRPGMTPPGGPVQGQNPHPGRQQVINYLNNNPSGPIPNQMMGRIQNHPNFFNKLQEHYPNRFPGQAPPPPWQPMPPTPSPSN